MAKARGFTEVFVNKDQRTSINDRLCFVCGRGIPDTQGCFHADLRILTHQGACVEIVARESRIYDRSARGRWRPHAEVLLRLSNLREQADGKSTPQPSAALDTPPLEA